MPLGRAHQARLAHSARDRVGHARAAHVAVPRARAHAAVRVQREERGCIVALVRTDVDENWRLRRERLGKVAKVQFVINGG